MQIVWYTCLISAICLEGLGRKYVPQVPAMVFYFLKDAVLVFGFIRFRPPPSVGRAVRYLYGGFGIAVAAGIAWTIIELANPQHESWMLGLIGLRAYWLWWIAPPVIAGFLQDERQKRRAIYVLLGVAMLVSVLAAFQFASPADSNLNLYSVQDGEEIHASDMATVASTGRARVASTFTFLSGFVDFCLLVPTLLLSIGLETRDKKLRRAALIATVCAAGVIPMSGSRSSVLLGVAVLLMMAWASGLFFTRIGRRILVGGGVAAILAVVVFPDAFLGVQDRFGNTDETIGRIMETAAVLPPVALSIYNYPPLGIGTGMQQNARFSLHADSSEYAAESEVGRYLVELGPIGYLIVWTTKLGLVVGLARAYAILKRAGRRGAAGAALSYAVLTMFGNLTFDHVWQALYFLGCGFVLAEVVSVLRAQASVVGSGALTSHAGIAEAGFVVNRSGG
jgi:hypothetical protein